MISKAKKLIIAASVFTVAINVGCKKKDDDDDDDDDDSSGTVVPGGSYGNGVSGSALSGAFPSELAIAAFPQDGAGALRLQDVDDPNADKTVTEKVSDNERKLSGEGDCLDPNQFRGFKARERVTCYEFDSDMDPFRIDGEDKEFGTLDGTNGAGEACLVAFARQEMEDVAQMVDRALATISGMLCQAKKDGLAAELPAEGEVLDLAASFGGAAGGAGITVSSASMTRLADVSGNAVYRSDVTITDGEGEENEIHLVHSPAADGSSTGTLWMKRPGRGGSGAQVDPNNDTNKVHAISVNYAKTLEDGRERMTAELRRAGIVNTIEPFTDAGLVAFANIPDDAPNSTIHAQKYVAFDMYPDTGEGSLSYWMNPGGNINEHARGFLFSMALDPTDALLAGCGVSGATANVSIRKALNSPSDVNTLKPVRFWHPQGNENDHPDQDDRYAGEEGAFITEQCFKQNTAGVYAIDTAKTTHERGYEVIAQAETDVLPPPAPKARLDGDFKPE